MDLRLAVMEDLPQIKAIYKEIIKNMDRLRKYNRVFIKIKRNK